MDHILEVLAKISPGTELREAIDNIIKARTGALIVIGGEPGIDEDCEGGVTLDVPFRHALVYELAKMDGAIVLNREITRIRRANVELLPKIPAISTETGMRHRVAERIARTRDAIVIAVSQRRSVVSIYWGETRYVLRDLSFILTKATGALTSLSRYDRLYRSAARRLSESEVRGESAWPDVVEVLRRAIIAIQIRNEIHRHIVEMGRDGRLVDLQLEEYPDLQREWEWIFADYRAHEGIAPLDPVDIDGAAQWGSDQWARAFGYRRSPVMVQARGFRLLHTVPRLPEAVIVEVIKRFGNLQRIAQASLQDLDELSDVGIQRAKAIYQLFVEPFN